MVVGMRVMDLFDALGEPEMVGASFPVFLAGDVEVALARTEQKTGKGYTGFSCETRGVTLEEDLMRRDLTINAMAMDPFTGKVFDPFGGAKDLAAKVLRPVGPHFGEDPLRVLRAARFAAQLGMVVSDELVLAAQPVLPELITLPGERLWGELEKALRTPKPSLFFEALAKMGALEVVLPEVDALQGRTQPEKYHPEGDAYVHTLEVVDRAAELGADDETMFAALTHDLGKAVTDDDNLPHHYNHEALGVPLVHDMCKRLHVPNSHRRVAAVTAKEHLNVHRFDDLKPVKKVRLLMRLGAVQGDQLARRVVLASKADARGRGPLHEASAYEQGDRLLEAAAVMRQVRGHEFAHLKDGQKIAQNMERARAKALKSAGF
jgi:tRNA nucleotidyltransferase (CCA-adding enzyme)